MYILNFYIILKKCLCVYMCIYNMHLIIITIYILYIYIYIYIYLTSVYVYITYVIFNICIYIQKMLYLKIKHFTAYWSDHTFETILANKSESQIVWSDRIELKSVFIGDFE